MGATGNALAEIASMRGGDVYLATWPVVRRVARLM